MAELHVGGEAGFDGFLRQRSARLWRAAWLLTGDSQHAEDLVQTALVKTYGKYKSMNDDDHFEAYVRKTIYRTFCSWWRRRSWRGEFAVAEPREDSGLSVADPELSVDVARALEELPRMQRSVVVLRYFEDRPVSEVAELLGISQGTVKSYAHRACESLRGSLHITSREE
ncbi:SigE family RNA polymerase sigma factor [Tessaracoccus terricola]